MNRRTVKYIFKANTREYAAVTSRVRRRPPTSADVRRRPPTTPTTADDRRRPPTTADDRGRRVVAIRSNRSESTRDRFHQYSVETVLKLNPFLRQIRARTVSAPSSLRRTDARAPSRSARRNSAGRRRRGLGFVLFEDKRGSARRPRQWRGPLIVPAERDAGDNGREVGPPRQAMETASAIGRGISGADPARPP